jgi:hypothetical protein
MMADEVARTKPLATNKADDPGADKLDPRKPQDDAVSEEEEQRPALPPRPPVLQPPDRPSTPHSSVARPTTANRPHLQARPTTALSSIDIQTLSFPDGSRGTFSVSALGQTLEPGNRKVSRSGSEIDDNASLMSYAPTMRAGGDLDSLLGDNLSTQSPAWRLLNSQADTVNPFETVEFDHDDKLLNFDHEFDELAEVDSHGGNEGTCVLPEHRIIC